MKRKTAFATVAVLLLLSLVFSPLLVVPVKAYGYDYGYGSASVMHACDADPTTTFELQNMCRAFNDIYNIFAQRYHYYWVWIYYPYYGYWARGDRVYGHVTHSMVWNNGDPYSTTTRNDVFNGIEDVDENHEHSTFLYVGHGGMSYFYGRNHYNFYMNGKDSNILEDPYSVPRIWDLEIYPVVQTHPEDNNHFVFLWVCFNGMERGDYGAYFPNGMPYCWTGGRIGYSTDGYASPDGSNYCFIGFDLASPRLEHEHNGPNHLYKHWLVFFYYYAVQKSAQHSVRLALDAASAAQGFADFTQTRLYIKSGNYPYGNDIYWEGGAGHPAGMYDVWMRVYGDGNYHIPGDVYHYPW